MSIYRSDCLNSHIYDQHLYLYNLNQIMYEHQSHKTKIYKNIKLYNVYTKAL